MVAWVCLERSCRFEKCGHVYLMVWCLCLMCQLLGADNGRGCGVRVYQHAVCMCIYIYLFAHSLKHATPTQCGSWICTHQQIDDGICVKYAVRTVSKPLWSGFSSLVLVQIWVHTLPAWEVHGVCLTAVMKSQLTGRPGWSVYRSWHSAYSKCTVIAEYIQYTFEYSFKYLLWSTYYENLQHTL